MGKSDTFPCEWDGCGKVFGKRSRLVLHMRVHTGERPFLCPRESCGASFTRKVHLDRHLLSHDGVRPFSCGAGGCDRAFTTRQARDRHEKTHGGPGRGKGHPCAECGESFRKHSTLRVHMHRVHWGTEPHPCEHCTFAASSAAALRRHVEKLHPEAGSGALGVHVCEICASAAAARETGSVFPSSSSSSSSSSFSSSSSSSSLSALRSSHSWSSSQAPGSIFAAREATAAAVAAVRALQSSSSSASSSSSSSSSYSSSSSSPPPTLPSPPPSVPPTPLSATKASPMTLPSMGTTGADRAASAGSLDSQLPRTTCPSAAYTFAKYSDLVEHKKKVHPPTPLPCPHCGKIFTVAGRLRRHVAAIHDGKELPSHKCPYQGCRRSYATRRGLVAHVRDKHACPPVDPNPTDLLAEDATPPPAPLPSGADAIVEKALPVSEGSVPNGTGKIADPLSDTEIPARITPVVE